MDFSDALHALKEGEHIRGTNWPDGIYIALHVPSHEDLISVPFLYAHRDKMNVPWTPVISDLFTDLWELVE